MRNTLYSLLSYMAPRERHVVYMLSTFIAGVACLNHPELDVLNESSSSIPWKVDYLFTAVELKLKKCLKRGYWISVHRFKASTMKVSFNPLLTRCDFVMMDVLNESCTKIPWKVD